MNTAQFKKKHKLDNKDIASFFDLSVGSFNNSTAKDKYIQALFRFEKHIASNNGNNSRSDAKGLGSTGRLSKLGYINDVLSQIIDIENDIEYLLKCLDRCASITCLDDEMTKNLTEIRQKYDIE